MGSQWMCSTDRVSALKPQKWNEQAGSRQQRALNNEFFLFFYFAAL